MSSNCAKLYKITEMSSFLAFSCPILAFFTVVFLPSTWEKSPKITFFKIAIQCMQFAFPTRKFRKIYNLIKNSNPGLIYI